jgi:hypothetical protein
MNDVLAPAPPDVVTPPPARRRRRWPRVVALVLVVAVGGSAIGAVVAVGRYAPLENGSSFGIRGAETDEATDYAGHSSLLLTYEHGEEFWYRFDLANEGPWGVEITEVPLPFRPGGGLESPIQQLEVRMAPRNDDLDARERVPFQPFALGPDEFRVIHIRARFWNCRGLGQDGWMSFDHQPVSFRAFGISRSMDVTLQFPLVVRSEDVASCPSRPGLEG